MAGAPRFPRTGSQRTSVGLLGLWAEAQLVLSPQHGSQLVSGELSEAVPGWVAERSCIGGSVGRGIATGVGTEGFVGGDGVDVNVRQTAEGSGVEGACRRYGQALRVAWRRGRRPQRRARW